MHWKWALTALVIGLAQPVAAEERGETTISAKDPNSLMEALKEAGYSAELSTDKVGDPLIETEFSDFSGAIIFQGCRTDTNDDCDAILLSVGFDRKKPWKAKEAIKLSRDYRFASVRLDDEGDPFVEWDIVTGDGIPKSVFLKSLRLYSRTIDSVGAIILADN